MRIIQVTDIHIGAEGQTHHGVDVRKQFLQVFDHIQTLKPEVIVFSGDLCLHEPTEDAYVWLRGCFEKLRSPYFVIAGNHDAQSMMQGKYPGVYHAETDEIYYRETRDGDQILFLDSARGEFSMQQFQWLEQQLDAGTGRCVIFMHHPPVYCGVPYLDTHHAFQQIPRLQDLLRKSNRTLHVFCGHYHIERELMIGNQRVCVTPSTFFQIDAMESDFAIDHTRPGYRIIDLDAGSVRSWCEYL